MRLAGQETLERKGLLAHRVLVERRESLDSQDFPDSPESVVCLDCR